jgi:hypothetical protein
LVSRVVSCRARKNCTAGETRSDRIIEAKTPPITLIASGWSITGAVRLKGVTREALHELIDRIRATITVAVDPEATPAPVDGGGRGRGGPPSGRG